jgi:hypothetical protein
MPAAESSASLREWWIRGGHQWRQSYLSLPTRGADGNPGLHIVVPPDVPPSMYLTAGSGYPFETILCAVGDQRCGDATRQWVTKAHAAFADLRTDRRRRFEPDRVNETPRSTSERCARVTASGDESARYAVWLDCVESATPRRATLPIGGFRVPTEGWLIVTGPRGDACDRVSAYDLASGAAVSLVSCTAERYMPRRRIVRTPVRADHVRVGSLRVDRLREAAWMLLLRGTAEDIRTDAVLYPLPEGLEPQTVMPSSRHLSLVGFGGVPGDMTTLVWALAMPNRPLVVGTVSWPESFNDADTYAASLLRVAEEGFVEGCAPTAPPPLEQISSSGSVFLNQAASQHRQSVVGSYGKWGGVAVCQ